MKVNESSKSKKHDVLNMQMKNKIQTCFEKTEHADSITNPVSEEPESTSDISFSTLEK